ncbi:MAG: hypothetical protein NZO58_08675, partial [Gemmataceae bacterium]|nr:hypothetical protein [Gemmataceae bacterium]
MHVDTPQTRCRAGIARCDITPPVGIYHRMWGAATHDRAVGVHRPLTATALWVEPLDGDRGQGLLVVALDHCVLERPEIERLQSAVAAAAAIRPDQVLVTLSHTHAAGLMMRQRRDQPGGDLIGPYLDDLARRLAEMAPRALGDARAATIVYGLGRCSLAAHRDFADHVRRQYVCGFNPSGPADDTVVAARVTAESGRPLATLVNY